MQFQSLSALITQHSAALHHLGKGKVTQELKDVSIVYLIHGKVILSYTTTTTEYPSKQHQGSDYVQLSKCCLC